MDEFLAPLSVHVARVGVRVVCCVYMPGGCLVARAVCRSSVEVVCIHGWGREAGREEMGVEGGVVSLN